MNVTKRNVTILNVLRTFRNVALRLTIILLVIAVLGLYVLFAPVRIVLRRLSREAPTE